MDAMAKGSSSLSLADLERLIHERRTQIESKLKQREQLASEIVELDEQMHRFLTTGQFTKRSGPRLKNESPLRTVLLDVLTRNKKGLSLRDIAEKVKDSGYKTRSRNFENVVYQCLYNTDGIVHDDATGLYKMTK